MVDLVIDTDIGIDCDDAMALAAAVALERQGKICTIGVSVVTARDGASAAVAAIGRKWGKAFDVSQYGGKLLACDKIDVYATKLRDLFGAVDASDCAVRFLRKKLATSSDKTTLVSTFFRTKLTPSSGEISSPLLYSKAAILLNGPIRSISPSILFFHRMRLVRTF